MGTSRRGRGLALLCGASLAASLTLGEIGLRALGIPGDEPAVVRQFDFGALFRFSFETDPHLLWVPRDYGERLERAGDEPAIVFMGDSCTHIGTYPEQFVALVGASRSGDPPSHLNLGVGAWSSFQGSRQLERDVLPLEPRIVTVYFGWNDHWVGLGDERVARGLALRESRLHLVRLLADGYLALLKLRQREDARRVPLDDFVANLTRIVAMANQRGVVAVLLTAPTFHRPGATPPFFRKYFLAPDDDLATLHREYADAVRQVAANTGAPLCDLAREFRRLEGRPILRTLFWNDGVHLTRDGDAVVARALHACFRRNGLLPLLLE